MALPIEYSSFSVVGGKELGDLAESGVREPTVTAANSDEYYESKTRQSDLDSTDINKIVARFDRAGVPLPTGESRFLDVSEMPDFRTCLDTVQRANEYFMELPAKSRALFDNDPAKFLDRVNDPAQLALLVEAGVVPPGEVKVVEAPEAILARERELVKADRRRKREIERELDREDPSAHK